MTHGYSCHSYIPRLRSDPPDCFILTHRYYGSLTVTVASNTHLVLEYLCFDECLQLVELKIDGGCLVSHSFSSARLSLVPRIIMGD